MTPKKKILIVLLILISMPILLTLINIGNNLVKRNAAKTEVKNARQDTEKLADKKIAEATDLLMQSGIVANNLASSKVDVCYVTHQDQGWFAASWYQDCYIRYVEGFITSFTQSEVQQKLAANSKSRIYFGEEDRISMSSRTLNCGLYENDYKTTLLYRSANLGSDEYSCKIPNSLQGVFTVKGPITLDDELSVKTFKTFDIDQISNSQNQVWIMFDEYYYHEELGCGVGIIFCNNPRTNPAHPEI